MALRRGRQRAAAERTGAALSDLAKTSAPVRAAAGGVAGDKGGGSRRVYMSPRN